MLAGVLSKLDGILLLFGEGELEADGSADADGDGDWVSEGAETDDEFNVEGSDAARTTRVTLNMSLESTGVEAHPGTRLLLLNGASGPPATHLESVKFGPFEFTKAVNPASIFATGVDALKNWQAPHAEATL